LLRGEEEEGGGCFQVGVGIEVGGGVVLGEGGVLLLLWLGH
jgi:hypothetical protein